MTDDVRALLLGTTLLPGDRVLWNGKPGTIVDPSDTKLGAGIDPRTDEGLFLIVADNGQLVWVRSSDLKLG